MSSIASGYFNFRRCILVDLMHGILVVWYHPYVKHRKWLLQLQALRLGGLAHSFPRGMCISDGAAHRYIFCINEW